MSQATLVDTSSTVPAIRPDARVLQADRRHQHHGHDERRGDRVGVADAERDAVDQGEHEHQGHGEQQVAHRLPEHGVAGDDDARAPDGDPKRAAARCAPASSLLAALRSRSPDAAMRWPMRQKISARSTKAAPMIVPSAIRNVILRNGSPGSSQPIATKYGCSAQLIRPPVTSRDADARAHHHAGAEGRGRQLDRAQDRHAMAASDPAPARPRCRRRACRRTGAAAPGRSSARRILATARPEGKVSCMRSTSIGV